MYTAMNMCIRKTNQITLTWNNIQNIEKQRNSH